jgi:hypothetical protein
MRLRRDSGLTNAEIVELIAKKLETGSGNVYNSCLIFIQQCTKEIYI